MTINEILQNVVVLNDETRNNVMAIFCMIVGLIGIGIMISQLIPIVKDKDIKSTIAATFIILLVLTILVFGIVSYIMHPVFVDLYISTNGMEIEQINKYFKVDQLSQAEGMTVCHITPKSGYYNEIVAAYKSSTMNEKSV